MSGPDENRTELQRQGRRRALVLHPVRVHDHAARPVDAARQDARGGRPAVRPVQLRLQPPGRAHQAQEDGPRGS